MGSGCQTFTFSYRSLPATEEAFNKTDFFNLKIEFKAGRTFIYLKDRRIGCVVDFSNNLNIPVKYSISILLAAALCICHVEWNEFGSHWWLWMNLVSADPVGQVLRYTIVCAASVKHVPSQSVGYAWISDVTFAHTHTHL
ncbi:hypothetical protein CBL_06425 [Carabus blaptoides fortunei]